MWKRKLGHASSISVSIVFADDGSSLRVVASLSAIAKEEWLRGLTMFMDLCGSRLNLRAKQQEIGDHRRTEPLRVLRCGLKLDVTS